MSTHQYGSDDLCAACGHTFQKHRAVWCFGRPVDSDGLCNCKKFNPKQEEQKHEQLGAIGTDQVGRS